jgi:hypothetical protein
VFGRLTDFRATSFSPPSEGPSVETRVEVAASLEKLTGSRSPIDPTGLAAALRGFFGPDTEACATITAGLKGADLGVPDAVTRLQNVAGSFRQASDAEVIASAAAAWADLAADHAAVHKMADTLDEDLPLVRRARAEVLAGDAGLPGEAAKRLIELRDLLAAGDLVTHRGEINDLTTKIVSAREQALQEARLALTAKVQQLRAVVRDRFPEMDGGKVDEALRPLDDLLPQDASAHIGLGDLRSRLEVAETRSAHAAHVLEELQAAGNLARVDVSQLVSEPITSEEELDVALGRIRDAVTPLILVEKKQVRLQ